MCEDDMQSNHNGSGKLARVVVNRDEAERLLRKSKTQADV